MKSKSSKNHYRSRQRMSKRITVVIFTVILLAVLSTLGFVVFHGFAQSVATGDKSVSDASQTTEEPTTTTIPTVPTIAVTSKLSSPRIVLYDETHSTVLYSSNASERCYPASLTKLMTAAVAVDQCTPDEIFTAGTELNLVDSQSSKAGLEKGYKLTRDQILDALLLPSGNDAAYTIAAHVGRKVSGDQSLSDIEAVRAFINLMNQKAQEIGATGTHFTDPDGFHDDNHYTTASDMLLIAENARKYDILKTKMAATAVHYTIASGQTVSWENTNKIIDPKSAYYFNGANGMKTGSTDQAGYCVVASAQKNGVTIVAVVMGSPKHDNCFTDADALFKQAFADEAAFASSAVTTDTAAAQ